MKITLNNVIKEYATVRAVDNVSFTVEPGEITALLGPNGAGKSSVVRMLVGLTQPDSGDISFGLNGDQVAALPREAFGYLPEDRGLYQDRTLMQNLVYIGQLRGMKKSVIEERIAKWLERFELTDRANEDLKQLSKGNQQKIQLIATLLHQPPLVILDEPFSGLDPINQEHVLDILTELREQNVTVLLSAHQMELVERMADKLVLMNLGDVVAKGTLSEIREQLTEELPIRLHYESPTDVLSFDHDGLVSKEKLTDADYRIVVKPNQDIPSLVQELSKLGPLSEFRNERMALHQLYLTAVKGGSK